MTTTFSTIAESVTYLRESFKPKVGWPGDALKRLVVVLASMLEIVDVNSTPGKRSEVISGGLITAGTVTGTAMGLSIAAVISRLSGKIKASNVLADVDLFTTAGQAGQAIYTDGTTAAAINIASNTARVAIILCDTDGAGGVTGGNGATKFVAIVKGTAATYDAQTAPPTADEITAALAASTGVHAGVGGGWVYLGHVAWVAAGVTIVENRDNHLHL